MNFYVITRCYSSDNYPLTLICSILEGFTQLSKAVNEDIMWIFQKKQNYPNF